MDSGVQIMFAFFAFGVLVLFWAELLFGFIGWIKRWLG